IKKLAQTSDCEVDPNLVGAAWYCANSGTLTHPGGQKSKNPWGLYDVLGNAHEWTNDVMKGLGYGKEPLVDPWGEAKISAAIEPVVLRGGGPITPGARCRSAGHFSAGRSDHGGGLGFRLVRTLLPAADASTADASPADAAPADASAE
ncbi:MAG: SUMF1/EgtB/PvdO family nonheme iron enzyme, partial [Myxococcales bacterium]|nr:SUMF1/EgtB/PvdO family nonheme iron enzyme [Myxococcales bacterium]